MLLMPGKNFINKLTDLHGMPDVVYESLGSIQNLKEKVVGMLSRRYRFSEQATMNQVSGLEPSGPLRCDSEQFALSD